MLDLTLEINLDDIVDEVDDLVKKQVPYVAYLALNSAVYKSSILTKKAMPYFIEGGPVPFTARGVRYTKAKSKHDLVATVYIPKEQWKYMRWIVEGGNKRWDQSKFGIGKPVYKNTRFNKYGNIPGRKRKEKVWRDMLNSMTGEQTVVRGRLAGKEFMMKLPSGDYGLMKRVKGDLKLLMVFTHNPATYTKGRFPFHKFAIKYVKKYFPRYFNEKLVDVVNRESRRLRMT